MGVYIYIYIHREREREREREIFKLVFCILLMNNQKFLDHMVVLGFPAGTGDKELVCQCRRHKRYQYNPWVSKIPWRRAWQPIPVLLPGESHDREAWWATVHGVAKSRMTEVTYHTGIHGRSGFCCCCCCCLRTLHTVFHNGCINLYSYQQQCCT